MEGVKKVTYADVLPRRYESQPQAQIARLSPVKVRPPYRGAICKTNQKLISLEECQVREQTHAEMVLTSRLGFFSGKDISFLSQNFKHSTQVTFFGGQRLKLHLDSLQTSICHCLH